MSLFVIGDLHLSGARNKPMGIFGKVWENHTQKIRKNWIETVSVDDTVLIAGDISWAMTMAEAKIDLDFIDALPGRKVFVRGNHDYWWSSVSKLNSMYKNMVFLQNSFTMYKSIAICGSRGWESPEGNKADVKTYTREIGRFRLSLESALKTGCGKIFFVSHYPPLWKGQKESGLFNVLKEYPVEKVFYGHLHGEDSFGTGEKGMVGGMEFSLVSADFLKFVPLKVLD